MNMNCEQQFKRELTEELAIISSRSGRGKWLTREEDFSAA